MNAKSAHREGEIPMKDEVAREYLFPQSTARERDRSLRPRSVQMIEFAIIAESRASLRGVTKVSHIQNLLANFPTQ
jgi:hypothetical protein